MSIDDRIASIEDHIGILDYLIWQQCENYLTHMWNCWDNHAAGSFNSGQTSIYFWYIAPMLAEYSDNVVSDWPWCDVGDYIETCYTAYDVDVMDRAFSDTIDQPTYEMEDCLEKAQELAILQEWLEYLISELWI